MSGRAADNRLVHFTPGDGAPPRPGDVVTTVVTRGAPTYLLADGGPLGIRRPPARPARRTGPSRSRARRRCCSACRPGATRERRARSVMTGPHGLVIAVVGPTAAGKSELSLDLARAVGGEVINADSMQLYRGMDIGTAKLTPAQQDGVPHHLLDVWGVTRAASVSEDQRRARAG